MKSGKAAAFPFLLRSDDRPDLCQVAAAQGVQIG